MGWGADGEGERHKTVHNGPTLVMFPYCGLLTPWLNPNPPFQRDRRPMRWIKECHDLVTYSIYFWLDKRKMAVAQRDGRTWGPYPILVGTGCRFPAAPICATRTWNLLCFPFFVLFVHSLGHFMELRAVGGNGFISFRLSTLRASTPSKESFPSSSAVAALLHFSKAD